MRAEIAAQRAAQRPDHLGGGPGGPGFARPAPKARAPLPPQLLQKHDARQLQEAAAAAAAAAAEAGEGPG